MTAARGVSGDVSVTVAGRKGGREKAGQANEAEGFATAMRGLGSARDEKSAAPASAAKAKASDRTPLHAGRQGDFARQHEAATIDRGEGKREARLASRFAGSKDEGAGAVAEEGGTTAGRKKAAQGASGDKRITALETRSPAGTDQGDVGKAETLPTTAKAEAPKGDGETAASRGRRPSRTEGKDAPIKPVAAVKVGAAQVEAAQDAEAVAASGRVEAENAEPQSSGDGEPTVDAKGLPPRNSLHERIIAERDPELRRLRVLQSGVGAENPAVELQLSAEEVAERLGILLPGEVDEKSQEDVVPARPRSGRVIVTVGRGDSYAVDSLHEDEAQRPARSTAEARSSAPLSPDAKLAAILGGFGLESKIVAAIAAEPESHASEIDRAAAPAVAAQFAGAGAGNATSAAAIRLPNAGDVQPQAGNAAAAPTTAAAPLAAQAATPGAAKRATAETPQAAAATPAAAGRASFIVPERGGRADALSDPLLAGRAAAASSLAGAAANEPVSANTQAAGAAVGATRMTTVRLPEQPGPSRSLGLGARVDLVSMRTDFEPATRRSERAGGGDASAGRSKPSPVARDSSSGAASARSVLAGLDAGLPAAASAPSAEGEALSAAGRATGLSAGADAASAATPRAAPGQTEPPVRAASPTLRPQVAGQPELPSAGGTATAAPTIQAEAGNRQTLGDLPARRTPTDGTLSAAATKLSAEPGLSTATGDTTRSATPTVVATSPDRAPALPADRATPTAPHAANLAKDGGAAAPASAETRGAAARMPASAVADQASASIGAKDAAASQSQAASGNMPARAAVVAEAAGTAGLAASRSAEPAGEGRQVPSTDLSGAMPGERDAAGAANDGRPSVAREVTTPTGRQADAMVSAAATGAETSRRGADPLAAAESPRATMTTAPASRGPAEAGPASVASNEGQSTGNSAAGESAATRPDAGNTAPRHDERAPSRQSEGSSPRNEPAPERVSRDAPVTGQKVPANAAMATMAEGSSRGASTAAPSVEPRGQASREMPVVPGVQPKAAATTAPGIDHPAAAEPSQSLASTNDEAAAEPLRPAAAMTDRTTEPDDRGQRQQRQPRAVDRPMAAMPTDEPKGAAGRTMPAAPSAQSQATAATTATAGTDRPVAAEPTQGMADTSGEPAAEPLRPAASMTAPATEATDRGQRFDQQSRAGERPGVAPLDDLVRSKAFRQPLSQTVRSEEGAVAASRQGMLSPSTAQVADALATTLARMDPAANAPVGADRTRLRAGGAALKTIQIQLAPEKLGKVNVTLKLIGGNLAVHIEASEPETAHRLKDDSEGLKAILKSAGFDVDEAVITLGARDAAGPRGAQQPAPQGEASASGQARGEGSANGQLASDGQSGQGNRGEDGRPRRPLAQPGASPLDGTAEAGGRNPGRDPSFYL